MDRHRGASAGVSQVLFGGALPCLAVPEVFERSEVLPDQLLEENAEAAGPTVVQLVYLGPYQFLRLICQGDHYFSHGSSRLL